MTKETHLNSGCVNVKLLEDSESFLEQLVGDGNVSDIGCIVVIEPGDVFHYSGRVCLYSRQDQQVLQVSVIAEYGIFQNDLLQQLDELVRQVGCHECSDSRRDIICILGLTQRCLNDLDITSVTFLWFL